MSHEKNPRRSGRVYFWSLGGLILVFTLLRIYQHFTVPARFEADEELLGELQTAALVTPAPAAVERGQWPQWRGPNRDGVSTETGLLTRWPKEGPAVLWTVSAGPGYSAIVVDHGRLYTQLRDGDEEAVVCLNAETGRQIWRFNYPCPFVSDQGSGPRSTPTVDGDRLYAVGVTGIFHCLSAATGARIWRHDLLTEFAAPNLQWGVAFSPLVEGDLVYTNPGGPNGSSIAAFKKFTGELAWKALDDTAGYSSPIAVTAAGVRQVIFFTGDGLVSLAPQDGRLYWRYPWATDFKTNVATPISAGNFLFISSGYGSGCALLKIEGSNGTLQARRVYEHNQMCNQFSSSILYQEHFYGFSEGVLTCMDLRAGKVVWKEKGFGKGSLLAADGHLLILGENGKLALAEAAPGGYHEKAKFRASHERCWTVPTLADGRLFVRDEQQIVCFDLRAKLAGQR